MLRSHPPSSATTDLAAREAKATHHRPTILVVDDDPLLMNVIRRILRRSDWVCVEAASVAAARDLLAAEDQPIDLMLTDIVLPDGDGCALASRARELRPQLRLLFMSGYGPEMLASHGLRGAFIGKPFTPEDLRARIGEQLEGPVQALTEARGLAPSLSAQPGPVAPMTPRPMPDPPGEGGLAPRSGAAVVGGAEGSMLRACALPIERLLEAGATLHLLEVDNGLIVRANAAFDASAGCALAGTAITALVLPASSDLLLSSAREHTREPFLLQFRDAAEGVFTLRCLAEVTPGGLVMAGEPPLDHHRKLEEQLFAINSEMSALLRENARQARTLAEAHRRLKDEHWHLAKISEVLPMCVECRKVRTGAGEDSWEAVETFLKRSTDFLSHGYCARCARQLEDSLDESEGVS